MEAIPQNFREFSRKVMVSLWTSYCAARETWDSAALLSVTQTIGATIKECLLVTRRYGSYRARVEAPNGLPPQNLSLYLHVVRSLRGSRRVA